MGVIAAGVVGGAALGAGGSIISGMFGASASKQQAAAIRYSADKGAETVLQMDKLARKDLAPFRQFGVDAGNQLMRLLLGNNSNVVDLTKASPLFQFQSELGMRNLNRELASRGLFGSGAGLETLQRFNNQLVGEEADRMFGRLFNVTSLGESAAARMGTNSLQAGQAAGNTYLQGGMAAAGAAAAGTRAMGQGIAGGLDALAGGFNQYAQYQMYKPLFDRLGMAGSGVGGGTIANDALMAKARPSYGLTVG